MSDLVEESCRVRLGIKDREDGGNIPGILFASCPAPDPPGTSSNGDSEPASSSDDSSATPRYNFDILYSDSYQFIRIIKRNFIYLPDWCVY